MNRRVPAPPTKAQLAWSHRTQTAGAPPASLWTGHITRTPDGMRGLLTDTNGWELILSAYEHGQDGFTVVANVTVPGIADPPRQDYGLRRTLLDQPTTTLSGVIRKDGRQWIGWLSGPGITAFRIVGTAKELGVMQIVGEG